MNAPAKLFSGSPERPVVGLEEVGQVYKPKERTVRVQAYVPQSFQEQMKSLGRLWSIIDRAHDEAKQAAEPDTKREPLKEWTEAEVVKRLLEAAMEDAWEEAGTREPASEEEWKRLEADFAKKLRSKSR
ncbi:MAG: hypothetical protein JNM17_06725 [Archangium sp.]|nr:hypothetical protein [Archangium sp.]